MKNFLIQFNQIVLSPGFWKRLNEIRVVDSFAYLPIWQTEFKIPFISKVKPRSHCATGRTYPIPWISYTWDQADGMIAASSRRLNFPYPVALIAVSKSAVSVGWIY